MPDADGTSDHVSGVSGSGSHLSRALAVNIALIDVAALENRTRLTVAANSKLQAKVAAAIFASPSA